MQRFLVQSKAPDVAHSSNFEVVRVKM